MGRNCWGAFALASVSLVALPAAAEPPVKQALDEHGLDHCGLEDPAAALDAPPVPAKKGGISFFGELPAVRRMRTEAAGFAAGQGALGGVLSGKTVYVSPGHGWVYAGGWTTQRGNTNGIIEDFVSVEAVGYYLVQHLRNMGAYVVPVRETDTNPNLSIVDDAGDGFSVDGNLSLSAVDVGYGVVSTPVSGQTNPFRSGGSRLMTASAEATGAAVWTFDVPETGPYNVYIGYEQDASRASDAHYVVRHAGGETHFRVDQRRHGQTWMLLGRFWFEAGASPELGSVALYDDSATPGATISADVARIGGGMNVMDRGGGVGNFPMFEVCARYYTQLAGAPSSVYDASSSDGNDDVGTRSRFAAWEHESGEDAVYVAWHTNAVNGSTRGTVSFAYSSAGGYQPISDFNGVAGSLELLDSVHSELVGDLRKAWDSGWPDLGQRTAYFGEVNPNHNPEMPSILVEVAFHDSPADADQLDEPRFRYIATRALAQGVARYFTAKDGKPLTLPPEPPTAPRVVQEGGKLVVRWSPPAVDGAGGDAPTSYRVYLSRDGYAFDNGHEATGTELVLDDAGGDPIYARVTAVNDGGESFASDVVGGRLAPGETARVLVVDGYTRLDGGQLLYSNYSAYGLGSVERALVDRINDGSYVARYGAALDAAGVSFHSADADAVGAGEVLLDGYQAVVWLAGEESANDAPLDESERAALAAYLASGGKLLFSGAELVWAFAEVGSEEEKAFVRDVLRVTYVADDAETFAVAPSAGGGLFDGIEPFGFDDTGYGGYTVEYPDVLAPGPGATEVLAYSGGTGGGAAIWWSDDATGAAALIMGFPLETVAGAEVRAAIADQVVTAFGVEPDPYMGGGDGDGDGDGDSDGDGIPDDEEILLSGGCGCQSGGPGGGPLLVLLALAIARGRRRLAQCRATWPTAE